MLLVCSASKSFQIPLITFGNILIPSFPPQPCLSQTPPLKTPFPIPANDGLPAGLPGDLQPSLKYRPRTNHLYRRATCHAPLCHMSFEYSSHNESQRTCHVALTLNNCSRLLASIKAPDIQMSPCK
ncbi:hypothetical protein CDAR_202921 [Caerostris darwini]|uniref:Uncharacterized protein n=1 Tax=Caerostris darwini TaxID=1538125 RepID=A0AAV4MF77_9ARAC|nr:hypothetical protein CDAR_202921 [Caerostris darwini]